MGIWRKLATLGFLGHALAVGASQVPADSALGAWVAPKIAPYLALTGNWQSWDMFDTAPRYHAYRVELIAVMPDGETRTLPPMLPDLTPQTAQIRDSTFFLRTIGGSFSSYFAGYAQSACDAVARVEGQRPSGVRVRQHIERLRTLKAIRESGEISEPATADSTSITCISPESR